MINVLDNTLGIGKSKTMLRTILMFLGLSISSCLDYPMCHDGRCEGNPKFHQEHHKGPRIEKDAIEALLLSGSLMEQMRPQLTEALQNLLHEKFEKRGYRIEEIDTGGYKCLLFFNGPDLGHIVYDQDTDKERFDEVVNKTVQSVITNGIEPMVEHKVKEGLDQIKFVGRLHVYEGRGLFGYTRSFKKSYNWNKDPFEHMQKKEYALDVNIPGNSMPVLAREYMASKEFGEGDEVQIKLFLKKFEEGTLSEHDYIGLNYIDYGNQQGLYEKTLSKIGLHNRPYSRHTLDWLEMSSIAFSFVKEGDKYVLGKNKFDFNLY